MVTSVRSHGTLSPNSAIESEFGAAMIQARDYRATPFSKTLRKQRKAHNVPTGIFIGKLCTY
jgi:hypothetical protein